jgi:hypothetical protein
MMIISNAKLSSTDVPRDPVSKAREHTISLRPPPYSTSTRVGSPKTTNSDFEMWASDQSKSFSGNISIRTNGSSMWIRDGKQAINDDEAYMPLTCTPDAAHGPCDLWDVFPAASLQTMSKRAALNETVGRLHGLLKDPQAMMWQQIFILLVSSIL